MTSIILPNYCPDTEVAGLLDTFLDSLLANTDRSTVEFVVVENGSFTERLVEIADVYVHYPEPIGYAKAVNRGLTLASGDTFVIVNNDLELPPNWLPILLADYEGGTLAPLDFQGEPGIHENAHWFSLVLFDRHTLEQVGLLDEDKLNYRFHDQEFSIKTKQARLPVRRTGNLIVKHINSATYSKMGRNEDPAEREEMIKRYGHALFSDWIKHESSRTYN